MEAAMSDQTHHNEQEQEQPVKWNWETELFGGEL